jgi:phosphoadenosine phosphosulfate reductase
MADILTTAQNVVAGYARAESVCFTCSFQAEDVVVLDLLRQANPAIPVLFLDTGYHFSETTAYRDQLAKQWKLNLVNLTPFREVGPLYQTDMAGCCGARKVEPLMAALAKYDVWFTGLRREQSPTRANLQHVEPHKIPSGHELTKVSPLAEWTWKEVWAYLKVNEIAHLNLYDQGYTSIGCAPCTQKPLDPENLRSGRWGGGKLECGIHTATEAGAK